MPAGQLSSFPRQNYHSGLKNIKLPDTLGPDEARIQINHRQYGNGENTSFSQFFLYGSASYSPHEMSID